MTIVAFAGLEVSEQTEHFIVNALRASGVLTISLVAEVNNKVIGHIAFSPVAFSDGTTEWFGLGPVSVHPDYQKQGVGSKLIVEVLERLKQMNESGCCLIGHPGYYNKFGFQNIDGIEYPGVPKEAIFALSFDGNYPQGQILFHDCFNAKS